jgi:hypothetical protein
MAVDACVRLHAPPPTHTHTYTHAHTCPTPPTVPSPPPLLTAPLVCLRIPHPPHTPLHITYRWSRRPGPGWEGHPLRRPESIPPRRGGGGGRGRGWGWGWGGRKRSQGARGACGRVRTQGPGGCCWWSGQHFVADSTAPPPSPPLRAQLLAFPFALCLPRKWVLWISREGGAWHTGGGVGVGERYPVTSVCSGRRVCCAGCGAGTFLYGRFRI